MKYKGYYIGSNSEDADSITSDEIIYDEIPEYIDTKLVDEHGKPIFRHTGKVKLGFNHS